MMDGLKLHLVFALVANLILIFIYLSALRKKNHSSLIILSLASVLAATYTVLLSISYFIEMSGELATELARYGLLLSFPAILLWVVGIRSLVNDYVSK